MHKNKSKSNQPGQNSEKLLGVTLLNWTYLLNLYIDVNTVFSSTVATVSREKNGNFI
jgi:hypothetical protein